MHNIASLGDICSIIHMLIGTGFILDYYLFLIIYSVLWDQYLTDSKTAVSANMDDLLTYTVSTVYFNVFFICSFILRELVYLVPN